jgi:hypothetical protein
MFLEQKTKWFHRGRTSFLLKRILKMRFEDSRIQVQVVNPDPESKVVVPLSLQLLLEKNCQTQCD